MKENCEQFDRDDYYYYNFFYTTFYYYSYTRTHSFVSSTSHINSDEMTEFLERMNGFC